MNNTGTWRVLAFLLVLFPCHAAAQFMDDFSDGNFSANPAWGGHTGDFAVNASGQLQLSAPVAGTSYLSAPAAAPSLDNMEWQFYIRLGFSPSSNNHARVYLVTDQADLTGPLNGYYLQFGESLSNDAIELFHQSGTGTVSVARGTDGFIASAFEISVKVTRDQGGNWSIFADPAAGTNYLLQATGTDANVNTSGFLGVTCTYTASNTNDFYFDDFYFGPLIVDTIPPAILGATATGPAMLDVEFTEPPDTASGEDEANYSVDNGIGNPSAAMIDAGNPALVHLIFPVPFTQGFSHTLTVTGVEDPAGNLMSPATAMFTFTAPVTATLYDVVINEVFFQFGNPQVLPEVEYVELYNRSSKVFNLDGWTIEDATGIPKVLDAFMLPPGTYLLLCRAPDTALLSPFGSVLGVDGFPGLNDAGDDVLLHDDNGSLIDLLSYDAGYYNDPARDDGGYSIERVDPDFTCADPGNWRASQAFTGGTPGQVNSVLGTFSDQSAPRLVRAFLSAPDRVTAVFSEPMSSVQLSDPGNFSISHGVGAPVAATVTGADRVMLQATTPFDTTVVYTLTAGATLTDCPGNAIGKRTARFATPAGAQASDILFNEVLYHPYENGSESDRRPGSRP